ncbi:AraC family transcriptional regulator [Streptomyces sp. NA04227]|uniref:AraC family transcriptional regulator n=1 Tax=Streptomyces sp. NA04227 TaxID=2742136 RepID=UPI0020CA64EA|nr:AraC family transcriptional regulator [Streptomyces sp. NA04227]
MAELGGDAEEYARRADFPVAALDADDLLVSDEALALLLEIAADDLDCPDLGLRIATRQDLGMLGPLALAIQNSETLGDALDCTTRYLFVHAPSMRIALAPDPYRTPGVAALRFDVREGMEAPPQATDLTLGFVHRAALFLSGPYGLRSVELPHPPLAPLATYEEFFGAPVRTDRPKALLRAPLSLTERPLTSGDAQLRRFALAFLAEQTAGEERDVATGVRAVVRQSLGTAPLEIGATARLLALHPRTLQRRLREQDTTFARIVDDERRRAARRYLLTTDLPLGRVAALLGLSEQSALTRCCRRWWGVPPLAVRRGGVPGE